MRESNQPDNERLRAISVRPGDTVLGKYVVGEVLGVGGMGVVMAAQDTALDRAVAIKFLQSRLAGAETAVRRFIREARAATRISNEHVVRLLDIDRLPDGTPFFVMERLHGRDLDALLDEQGCLPSPQAVDYSLQALEAIAEGHLKGVVHRDIKPSNLFLTLRADGTPLIKVLDFGIAKTIDEEPTQSAALTSSEDVRLGSPAYMPPEQLRDPRDVDTRSDFWALGVTLYELVSGSPPFGGQGYIDLVSSILSAKPKKLSSPRGDALPDGLEAVIFKCLAKERSDRYGNAAELAAALAPFGGEDARLSLSRVRGLWSSSSSIPPVSLASPSARPQSSTTTLPVATEPDGGARVERSSPPGPVNLPRKGSWIAITIASTVVVAAAIAWRQPGARALEPAAQAAPDPASPRLPTTSGDAERANGSTPAAAAPSAAVTAPSAAVTAPSAAVTAPSAGGPKSVDTKTAQRAPARALNKDSKRDPAPANSAGAEAAGAVGKDSATTAPQPASTKTKTRVDASNKVIEEWLRKHTPSVFGSGSNGQSGAPSPGSSEEP